MFISQLQILRIKWHENNGNFSIKTFTWANNDSIKPHPKTKFLNDIWSLKLTLQLKFFAWILVRKVLPTRYKLRNICWILMVIVLFCQAYVESIAHLFKECYFVINIWTTINYNCHCPFGTNYDIIDGVEHIWNLRKS